VQRYSWRKPGHLLKLNAKPFIQNVLRWLASELTTHDALSMPQHLRKFPGKTVDKKAVADGSYSE
jgi:hypothetical protein